MNNFQHDQIPETALGFLTEGKGAALATVIQTWGSAPRPVGSQLAVSSEAEIMGSVSGGCVEGAVVVEALEAMEDGTCRILEYGVSDEEAFAVGLACGGTIRVMVEPIGIGQGPAQKLIQTLVAGRFNREPVAYVVNTASWQRAVVSEPSGELADVIASGYLNDKSTCIEEVFVGIHNPPLRMAIVGAVHIAQPLCQMARLAGYDVVLVDPRDSFGSQSRFPSEEFLSGWPDAALKAYGLDRRTAVVTLTHDPKLDNPAIEVALKSDVFYLGCLGSKKTHAKRVAYLQGQGFSAKQIARIHGPIGADIGSKSPAEIAISIMAQITERLRRPDSRP